MPAKPRPRIYASVPKLWPGETVVCIASGPSLTEADVNYVRGRAHVIAINNNWELAPWADVLHANDGRWWHWHKGVPSFKGLKYSLSHSARMWPDVNVLRRAHDAKGISFDPKALCNYGLNSGYAAINLAVHLGAKRIILLGYDMQVGPNKEEHWHKDHRNRSRSEYPIFLRRFSAMTEPLEKAGIEVINCTRRTAIETFPLMSLEDALPFIDISEHFENAPDVDPVEACQGLIKKGTGQMTGVWKPQEL